MFWNEGSIVQWGNPVKKGKIIAIVHRGKMPRECAFKGLKTKVMFDWFGPNVRNHESYLVVVTDNEIEKLYWPRVSQLTRLDKGSAQ